MIIKRLYLRLRVASFIMNLSEFRANIDKIDSQLVDLLVERMANAKAIGDVKKSQGLPIFAPERERSVYERLCLVNQDRLPQESITAIFREIMSMGLFIEEDLHISYLGPAGSWTHQAALNKFGHSVNYRAAKGFEDVFEDVQRGKAQYGVLPVENSTEGAITTTLDLFLNSPLHVCSQTYLKIEHCLLSLSPKDKITTIYSHPQGFLQCRNWLAKHLPNAQLIEASSTSKAVEIAKSSQTEGVAAIAPPLCSEIYDYPIVEASIQDLASNTTRFFIISNKSCPPTGRDRTSLVFSVKHEPGSLVKALQCLETNNINLCSIQSRPCKSKEWEYVFFTDLEAHHEDENMKNALEELNKVTQSIRVLGSYPAPLADVL